MATSLAEHSIPSEFLNPSSMLTPGLAGIVVMTLSNTLTVVANLPPAYIALALSFLVGALVLQMGGTVLRRLVYYVLNSLFIFNMAIGGNAVGLQLRQAEVASVAIVSNAFAQSSTHLEDLRKQQGQLAEQLAAAQSDDERSRLLERLNAISAEINTATNTATPNEPPEFFKVWSFLDESSLVERNRFLKVAPRFCQLSQAG